MRLFLILMASLSLSASLLLVASCSSARAAAGPNGGDVVPIQNGTVKAEVITNADTGEVMVHTWDPALKNHQPIDAQPMTLGSGESTVELMPHPLPSDPPGRCSRFYGQAEWVRGGGIERGWLRCCGGQGTREDFAWSHCWSGGRSHGQMWSEMGEHRRGMGGPGMGGHR